MLSFKLVGQKVLWRELETDEPTDTCREMKLTKQNTVFISSLKCRLYMVLCSQLAVSYALL